LVGYPIFDLRGFASHQENRKTVGAVEFVRRLETVLIRTCADFGIDTERVPGLTGVWTKEASGRVQAKIAAIGVHISRAVTSHGFALNVNTDLSYFSLIVPCGITAKPVTSMERELGRQVDIADVEKSIARSVSAAFDAPARWLNSLDELMGAAVGVPLKTPPQLRDLHKEEESFWA
jgi:lipoyl(octanoyl) transferase